MIRAIAFACLIGLPVHAQEMTRETCRLGWEALNILIEEDGEMITALPDLTPDGLCRIDTSNAPLEKNDFESVEWRAAGVEEAVAQQGVPLSLEAEFTGIDLVEGLKLQLGPQHVGRLGTMRFDFTRDAATRDITLEEWTTDFGPLGALGLRASGGGIDLSSLKTMQFTWGGLRVFDVDLTLKTTPGLSFALFHRGFIADPVQSLAMLPDGALDDTSEAALSAFLQAGTSAHGTFTISARSQNGVGFLQMVGGVRHMEEAGFSEAAVAEGLSILMEGVTLKASWRPEG